MTRLQSRSLLVGMLVLASLALLGLNQTGALNPVKGALTIPLTGLQRGLDRVWGNLTSFFNRDPDVEALRQHNADLEAQITQLQARVTELEEHEAERLVLAGLLNYAREQPDNRYLAANVIGQDASPFLSYLFLDQGSDAGIRRGMPVVTERGLVGQVVEVTAISSKVLLVTDAASAVNARLQNSRDLGIVVGRLGGGLEMQNISQQAEVNPGDVVITSGLGGKYPAGIPIGAVSAVQKQDYQVQQSATLASAVDFRSLEIVLIITNFKPVDFSPFLQATPTP